MTPGRTLPIASAMSPINLKAVDQVVKIVLELDRYGGAFAAEWARPEASRQQLGVFGCVNLTHCNYKLHIAY